MAPNNPYNGANNRYPEGVYKTVPTACRLSTLPQVRRVRPFPQCQRVSWLPYNRR
jgi:hypothetical protein